MVGIHLWFYSEFVFVFSWGFAAFVKCSVSCMAEFKAVTKDICKLPSFLSTTLFRKLDVNNTGIVTRYVRCTSDI